MKWQWKLARIAGIDVYMHATFLLLIGWVAFSHWTEQGTLQAVLSGVLFILLLFGFVVMHEYGHALTARKFGIRTRDITLYPIGGVARLERMPEKPIEELWVALAGPAVNVVVAAALFGYLLFTRTFEPFTSLTVSTGSFIERLMIVNLWLVGFNLIPAFPMDGGRVLRALLGLRMEYVRATQIAANVGQAICLPVWVHRPVQQSLPDIHCFLRLDGCFPGSQHGADEILDQRYPGHARDADGLSIAYAA